MEGCTLLVQVCVCVCVYTFPDLSCVEWPDMLIVGNANCQNVSIGMAAQCAGVMAGWQ